MLRLFSGLIHFIRTRRRPPTRSKAPTDGEILHTLQKLDSLLVDLQRRGVPWMDLRVVVLTSYVEALRYSLGQFNGFATIIEKLHRTFPPSKCNVDVSLNVPSRN